MAYIRIAMDKKAIERACEFYLREKVLDAKAKYNKPELKIEVELLGATDTTEVLAGYEPEPEEPKKEGE